MFEQEFFAQVQGQMHIYEREWCNMFVYTVNGAALFHVRRDREYWAAIQSVMGEFWWGNVVPARHALAKFMADPQKANFFVNSSEAQLEAAKREVTGPYMCVFSSPPPPPLAAS